jgi:hypothetical protein
LGDLLFTFLMVFREGVETVLFLATLSLSSGGLLATLGALLGLGSAVAFGVLFVRGSMRIDLGPSSRSPTSRARDLRRTAAVQRLPRAVGGGWVPASRHTMAVRSVGAQQLLLHPGGARPAARPAAVPGRLQAPRRHPGAAARLEAPRRREGRARAGPAPSASPSSPRSASASSTAEGKTLSPANPVTAGARPLQLGLRAAAGRFHLHRFAVDLGAGRSVRIIAVETGGPTSASRSLSTPAMRHHGYLETGGEIECLHCGAAIYPRRSARPAAATDTAAGARAGGGWYWPAAISSAARRSSNSRRRSPAVFLRLLAESLRRGRRRKVPSPARRSCSA